MKKKIFLGFVFRNVPLLTAALTHPSFSPPSPESSPHKFNRLEFFGDAFLNYAVCKKIYTLYPDASEGELSRLRSALVSRKTLARVARSLSLARSLRTGNSLRGQRGSSRDKVLADSLEAVIAAIFFEQGADAAEDFIIQRFAPYFSKKSLARLESNPKSDLQELTQQKWHRLPVYTWKKTRNAVRVEISVPATPLKTAARAAKKRLAEEKAANALIRKIRQAAGGG